MDFAELLELESDCGARLKCIAFYTPPTYEERHSPSVFAALPLLALTTVTFTVAVTAVVSFHLSGLVCGLNPNC
ncbi:hypothetical protein BDV06DRAFT_183509 [Aspergillus oleicola]